MKGLFNNRIAALAAIAAAAVVGWFVDKGILTGEQATEATGQLTTALNGLGAAAFAVFALMLGWVVRKLSGGNASGNGGSNSGSSGGNFPILITAAALSLAGFALSSCSSLSFGADRCLTSQVQRGGMTYQAGACFNLAGKIDRIKVQWKDSAGREGRAYIYKDDRPAVVEYKTEAGLWVRWTEGGGVVFEQMPPEVIEALEGEVTLPG